MVYVASLSHSIMHTVSSKNQQNDESSFMHSLMIWSVWLLAKGWYNEMDVIADAVTGVGKAPRSRAVDKRKGSNAHERGCQVI